MNYLYDQCNALVGIVLKIGMYKIIKSRDEYLVCKQASQDRVESMGQMEYLVSKIHS